MFSKDREVRLRQFDRLLHGIGVLCVLSTLFAYHFTFRRAFNKQQLEHRTKIVELQKSLRTKVAVRNEHARLNEALAELEELAKHVNARIPESAQEGEFLRQVSEAAQAESMEISNYQRGNRFERESHSELEVQFVCEGGYANICGFLDRLDKMSRVATIQRMELKADPDRSVYPVQFNLLLYFGIKKQSETKNG